MMLMMICFNSVKTCQIQRAQNFSVKSVKAYFAGRSITNSACIETGCSA